MDHKPGTFAISVLILTLFTLAACSGETLTPADNGLLLPMSTPTMLPCDGCDQATLAAALTQEKNNADYQAAATAAILRANAQATLNSANATLGAAQTQQQYNADIIAAQIAATAEIVRANAQATLNSAGSTQSAAMTQDSIRQTQAADQATSGAQAILNRQYNDALAANTQTAVANSIATQTQAAVATSQWYADQARQRDEQRRGPITFLWMWCLPIFIVLLAILALWGFWRWLKIQQVNQGEYESPVEKLPTPVTAVIPRQQEDALPYLESDLADNRYQLSRSDDQVRRWLAEVKSKLLSSDKKDEDDDNDD
jgi:hypothetical protein